MMKEPWIYNLLSDSTSNSFEGNIAKVFQHTTWVGLPLLSPKVSSKIFGKDGNNT